ncbi:MAG: winged helix-turn-helix domain-containing protein [Anaerolineae bacterium]|nr:winged helix-turn-helix domain-containing protein [Anaerolineae bacterium]
MSSRTIARDPEIARIVWYLAEGQCVSLAGLTNTGKSTLLRDLRSMEARQQYHNATGREASFVYVDCNAMLEISVQGFYELVLRAVRQNILDISDTLRDKLVAYYKQIVEPDTPFLVPLSFNNALTALIEEDRRDLVLLFDEFDEAFDALDGRVFLNLRALKDRYGPGLSYVTATIRQLDQRRSDDATAEFVELSAGATVFLPLLTHEQSAGLAQMVAQDAGLAGVLAPEEVELLWNLTGGHPRMLRAAVGLLVELFQYTATGAPVVKDLAEVERLIAQDVSVRGECVKLWAQLAPQERAAALQVALGAPESAPPGGLDVLRNWGLIMESDGRPALSGRLLAAYLREQQAQTGERHPEGLNIDRDAGTVWIDGNAITSLTDLEFRLITLLEERANKVTDKYQIVETVWGVNYLDEIDDARIEKLVSRLRAKIEPNPAEPRYIVTLRGRGYRLVLPG